ncbi:MAG TPA: uroporphyrinogen decarboxylase family protein, partial [Chlamydiales bacterium]|nr:uroporphyrinogen decarboxylase family protein [Chlamydiales bacterium]
MSLFLDALQCRNQGRAPMWFMRQAGRYLPEYRAIRSGYPLETMFNTPSIATEITMQPIERFGLDAAILFADILTP